MSLLPGTTKHLPVSGGITLAVRTWGGTGGEVLYLHATGFSKELWGPVVDRLDGRAGRAFDQRGHGDSGEMPIPLDWSVLRDDVANVLAAEPSGPVIGVGHSSGGAALAMAAINDPHAFRHLILIEPIIFPPPHQRLEGHPMSRAAARRRASFPDRLAALEHFSRKESFAGWTGEALDAYLDGALRDMGTELVLKCTPRTEAEHYRSGSSHSAWDRLDEITCRVTLVAGAESTTHDAAFLAALSDRFTDAEVVVVPLASHLVPMERPGVIAGLIGGVRGRE